jgi:hypothetical protein
MWQTDFQAGNFPSAGTCCTPVQVPVLESKRKAVNNQITVKSGGFGSRISDKNLDKKSPGTGT